MAVSVRTTQELLNHFNINIRIHNNSSTNNLLNTYMTDYADVIVEYNNNDFTRREKANLVLEILTGMNMNVSQRNTWINEINRIDPLFYKEHLALTAGQQKLLIQEILNYGSFSLYNYMKFEQLVFIDQILTSKRFDICNIEEHFSHNRILFSGDRNANINDIIIELQAQYDANDKDYYIYFSLQKIFGFSKFSVNPDVNLNLNQLSSLLYVMSEDLSINERFNKFLQIYDAQQIIDIGM